MIDAAPYASVIVPTHSRAATLPLSIASIQAQTIADIEILIVGDGVTDAVRSEASALAAGDARVRFLDLPKAPLRGGANRDLAVRKARSPRVFYNDDDDVWLRHHVATLGPLLDDRDVVDTPVVTVGTHGGFHLGQHDSSNEVFRTLLMEERFKAVFDTHLAHRKEAYLRVSSGWGAAPDHRVVLHLLKGFAQLTSLRWITVDRITALSLHGASRVAMSDAERATELHRMWRVAERCDAEQWVRQRAGYCGHFARLERVMSQLGPAQHSALSVFLTQSQAHPWIDRAAHRRWLSQADLQSRSDDLPLLAEAFVECIEPLLGPRYPIVPALRRYQRALGSPTLLAMLEQLDESPLAQLARLCAELVDRTAPITVTEPMEQLLERVPAGSRFFFGLMLMDRAKALGNLGEAQAWSDRLLPLAPAEVAAAFYWKSRADLLDGVGQPEQAAEARATAARLEACADR